MWTAFCDELVNSRAGMRQPFYYATPEEARQSHVIFTQALAAQADAAVLKMRVNNPAALIRHAWENGYAIPAFNVCNLEFAKAIIEAAEVENSPVILQTYPADLRYAGLRLIAAILRMVSDETPVPALLHPDHPEDLTMILESPREGYMSVMFDGGHPAIDQNVRETARIAGIAHAYGAIVEGELGQFGGERQGMRVVEARSCDVRRMFEEGRVDMLAVSVGSVDGEISALPANRIRSGSPSQGRDLAGNADWQRDLAVAFSKLGDVLQAQGKLDEAHASHGKSLMISQRLAAQGLSNADQT